MATKRVALFVLVVAAWVVGPRPALADAPLAKGPNLALTFGMDMWRGPNETSVPKSPECKPGTVAGPATGIALGTVGLGVGSALIAYGATNINDLFEEPTRDAGDIAAITGGSLVLAGSLFGIIYSSIRIRRTKQERSVVCVSRNDGY